MTKPKVPCAAFSVCTCGHQIETKRFTSDQTLARWPEITFSWFNVRCGECNNTNAGELVIKVWDDPANTEPKEFKKDTFFEYYYKLHYDWCEVQGCEAKFYKEGKYGHHLCTTHYEEALKIDAENNEQPETN